MILQVRRDGIRDQPGYEARTMPGEERDPVHEAFKRRGEREEQNISIFIKQLQDEIQPFVSGLQNLWEIPGIHVRLSRY